MPRTKGALEHSEFKQGRIVGQYDGGLGQRKISENLSITLTTVNSAIVNCTR